MTAAVDDGLVSSQHNEQMEGTYAVGVVGRAGVEFEAAVTATTTCQGGSASQCWQLGALTLFLVLAGATVVEQRLEGVE